jgi:hypothetical protein
MSNAKFAAAKELIEEQHYEAARAVLKTINEPKAQDWLKKLDKLSPDFPETSKKISSNEQDKYYERENRKAARRRFFNGFELIVLAIFCFGVVAFFAMPRVNLMTGVTEIDLGFSWILIPIGLFALVAGIRRMTGKSR